MSKVLCGPSREHVSAYLQFGLPLLFCEITGELYLKQQVVSTDAHIQCHWNRFITIRITEYRGSCLCQFIKVFSENLTTLRINKL